MKKKRTIIEALLQELKEENEIDVRDYKKYLSREDCPDKYKELASDYVEAIDRRIQYDLEEEDVSNNSFELAEGIRELFFNIIEKNEPGLLTSNFILNEEFKPDRGFDHFIKHCTATSYYENLAKQGYTSLYHFHEEFGRHYYNIKTYDEYLQYENEISNLIYKAKNNFASVVYDINNDKALTNGLQCLYAMPGKILYFDEKCGLINGTFDHEKCYPICVAIRNVKVPKYQTLDDFIIGKPKEDAYFDFMVIDAKTHQTVSIFPTSKEEMKTELKKTFRRARLKAGKVEEELDLDHAPYDINDPMLKWIFED